MIKTFLHLVFVVLLLSPYAGAEEEPIVAEGAWGKITQLDLECARRTAPRGATDETLIEQLARDQLGAQKAIADGLEREPATRWRLWSVDQSLGTRELYDTMVATSVQVTTEEVKKAYEERLQNFRTPGTFSFRYIFADTTECKSPAEVTKVREKIDQAMTELLSELGEQSPRPWIVSSAKFVEVAEKFSDVKTNPGRVAGPFKFDEPLQPVIKSMVLSLQKGEVSPVFSTRWGYEIVQLEDRIEDSTAEFEKVAASIRQDLENTQRMQAAKEYVQSLREDKSRYDIYEDRLVHMLPGAHFEVPSTTAVVRVGKKLYAPEELEQFLKTLYPRDWVRSRTKDTAIDLTWRAFILPQLIHEEAAASGFTEKPTEEARAQFEKNSILTGAWVTKETERITSGFTEPTTDEISDLYEKEKNNLRVSKRYRMTIITHPIEELKTKGINPAQTEFLYRAGEDRLSQVLAQVTTGASPEAVVKATEGEEKPLKIETKWVSEGLEFPSGAWESLTHLGPGDWSSDPIRTDKGVTIVGIIEVTPERVKTLKEVFQVLKRQIASERTQETRVKLIQQLTEEAKSTLKIR